jgi:hypothetical protein
MPLQVMWTQVHVDLASSRGQSDSLSPHSLVPNVVTIYLFVVSYCRYVSVSLDTHAMFCDLMMLHGILYVKLIIIFYAITYVR